MRVLLLLSALLTLTSAHAQEDKRSSDVSPAAPGGGTDARDERGEHSDRFPVEIGGKWGYVDRQGALVIDPVYDQAWPFREGRGRVLQYGRFGFVDAGGELVVPLRFDNAYDFSGGRARVVQFEAAYSAQNRRVIPAGRKLNGFVGTDGAVLVTPQYFAGRDYTDGVALVRLTEGMGRINLVSLFRPPITWVGIGPDGARLFDTYAADVGRFSEGRAAFVTRGSLFSPAAWGYLNTDGSEAIRPKFDQAYAFSEGLACVGMYGKAGYINRVGEKIVPPRYSACGPYAEGVAPVQDAESRLWGYIDTEGAWRVAPQFTYADAMQEGAGMVQMPDGRFGFVDPSGAFLLEPIYDWSRPFEGGLAYVRQGSTEGYVDRTGTFVWQKPVDAAGDASGDEAAEQAE